ncbi:MAG: hypothetical protein ACTHU0_02690 [Kofleriaceae bacterium]
MNELHHILNGSILDIIAREVNYAFELGRSAKQEVYFGANRR